MIYTAEVQHMCPVAKGAYHGQLSTSPKRAKWVQAKGIKVIVHLLRRGLVRTECP